MTQRQRESPMRFASTCQARPQIGSIALGFTLLEALLVVALLGILVSLAAPAMGDLQAKYRLQAHAEGFLESLILARSEAIRRQQRVSLCPRANDATCDASGQWSQGWLVFVDSNDNALRDADEPLLEDHSALPQDVKVALNSTIRSYFAYGSEGRSMAINGAFMAGTLRFCQPTKPAGWQVVINALGKPRIEKYAPQACL